MVCQERGHGDSLAVIPTIASKAEDFLGIESLSWDDLHTVLVDPTINKYQHLVQRIDLDLVNKISKTN
ncbi:hypothetical protein ACFLZV_02055 [Candidatus Margulisiibacteriota bacterium]